MAAAVRAGRARQVALEVRVLRARDVARGIGGGSRIGGGEFEAAVEDDDLGTAEQRAEL